MRYFFHIGYNGANYNGWQKLPQADSVQLVLENLLKQIFKNPIEIVGCGRTDSRVHAGQFFFHADIVSSWDFDLLFRLNKNLPNDIAVFDVFPMEGQPHARLDATTRTYDYFIHTYKDPFLSHVSALYAEPSLKMVNMSRAVALLTRYNNYASFCKNAAMHRTTICQVDKAALYTNEKGNRIRFHISANRFLRGMVRIIANKLVQIGKDEMSIEEFERYLSALETPATIIPAPPEGLFLSKVTYPFLDVEAKPEFLQGTHHTSWIAIHA
jgi:tRNA pseudouridine38-40 synthase